MLAFVETRGKELDAIVVAFHAIEAAVAPPVEPVRGVAALVGLTVLFGGEIRRGGRKPRLHRLEAGRQRIGDGHEAALLGEPERERHPHEIARRIRGDRGRGAAAVHERRVTALHVETGIEPLREQRVGGITQPGGIEEGAGALTREGERRRGSGRAAGQHLRHRHARGVGLARPAAELVAHELFGAELHGGAEVGHGRLVLAVVRHERFHRVGVLLRVAPAAVRARGHHPAHHLAQRRVGLAGLHERVEHDGGRAHVGVPEPEQIGIGQLAHVGAAALRQNRVRHAAPQVGGAIVGGIALGHHGVVQIRQGKHRHALAIAVEPGEVRIDRPAAFGQHLHGKRLPGGVARPPLFVAHGWLCRQLAFEIPVGPIAHIRAHGVFQIGRRPVDVQHVGGEIRRHRVARARPVGKPTALALEGLDLLERLLCHGAHLGRGHARQRERVTEIGGQHEGE